MTAIITESTPIAMLTVGQLKELMQQIGANDKQDAPVKNGKKYVYGLVGIRQLFNVSHTTAQKYKDTFLKPAILQQGRKIVVDVEKAMELFRNRLY